MNIKPKQLSLSVNYITFFDKLEKANFIYNYVIEKDTNINYLMQNILNEVDYIVSLLMEWIKTEMEK